MIISNKLHLHDIQSIVENQTMIEISEDSKTEINNCFSFLKSFSNDKIIYGINTGFGPMAQ